MPSMTINYTVSEGQRFSSALGKAQSLVDAQGAPRDATAAECKALVIRRMTEFVFDVESRIAADTASAAVTQISPT